MYGGQQEHGIRPGTLPVALIAGCGEACEISQIEHGKNSEKVRILKELLLKELAKAEIEHHFNGNQKYCIDSTANIYFPGVMSEALMLSTKMICGISNGSACTSKSYTPSYVLLAMGLSVDRIESSVRISWGPDTDPKAFLDNISKFLETAKQIRI